MTPRKRTSTRATRAAADTNAALLDPPEDDGVLDAGDAAREYDAAPIEPAREGEVLPPLEQLPFFDHLRKLSTADWDHHLLYLYRSEPGVKNAEKDKYICRYSSAIDQSDVKPMHGGGTYMLLLKNTSTEKERRHSFAIEGPAILQEGQMLRQKDGSVIPVVPANQAQPAATAAPAASADNGAMREILGTLNRLVERLATQQQSNPADKALGNAIDIISAGAKSAAELVAKREEGKDRSEQNANDKLVAFLMDERKKGGAGAASDDPIGQLERLASLIAVVDKLRGTDKQPAQTDLLTQIKTLKEVLGDQFGDLLGDAAGGARDSNLTSLLVETAGKNLPEVLGLAREFLAQRREQLNLQRATMARQGAQLPPPVLAPAPVAAAVAPPPVQPNLQPIAASSPTQPAGDDLMSTEANIALMIYSVYRANLGGDDAAIAVRNEFPSVVELLKPRLGNLAGVMDYCRKSPILARIVNDEDFAEFAGDFVDEILNPTPDDVEDEPQQARGAAAGAGPVPISGADETPSIS